MSGIAVVLCFLLYLLIITNLTVCHTVVKRKAPEGQLYVFSEVKGCVSVESEEPCPLTWQLNPFLAKVYRQQSEVMNTTIKFLQNSAVNDRCIQLYKNTSCSQLTPRCSADGIRNYEDKMTTCQSLHNSCPKIRVNCHRLKTGKYPSLRCLSPPTSIKGVCSPPKFKMPDEILKSYEQKSENLVSVLNTLENLKYSDTGKKVLSSKCLSQLKDINCSPIYCSANESLLLIKHDQDDCKNLVDKCFKEFFSKASNSILPDERRQAKAIRKNFLSNCKTFPLAGAELVPEPSAGNWLNSAGRSIALIAACFLVKSFL
ncbi:uncharacterized protein LOC114519059 [Dendronephthya gigantea]|uniref:uncharacterized protein LOC114519059 n=1 Tax=Dendronephthya gigantea TaxID=151771 RepID=UPI00106AFDA7|nr:uncharacterized protein LOC114519059 [Dendronephthya gigantea]